MAKEMVLELSSGEAAINLSEISRTDSFTERGRDILHPVKFSKKKFGILAVLLVVFLNLSLNIFVLKFNEITSFWSYFDTNVSFQAAFVILKTLFLHLAILTLFLLFP